MKATEIFGNRREAQWQDWHWQMGNCLQGVGGLTQLGLKAEDMSTLSEVVERYAFGVTPYYASLADWDDELDPVRRQCFPSVEELNVDEDGEEDPFGDGERMPVPGLVQRFADRVLVVGCRHCATYCRHCTRKNVLGRIDVGRSREAVDGMVRYIEGQRQIREVIISGGDPLLMDNESLMMMIGKFRELEQIESIRIGTRLPVVLPMRIDDELAELLARYRPLWINTQFNHPVELTDEATVACERLLSRGIQVSNQCVLLKGVNDELEVMRDLCAGLQRNGIRPYYVFSCDPVTGTTHFRVSLDKARAIRDGLQELLGGLAIPRFVVDRPGELCKRAL